jgi:hypothetical protein
MTMRNLATLLRALLWMLILSWLMAAASASAGWSMLGMLDGQTYSMDVNNISTTRQGNRLFWALMDYNHATAHGARSVAMQFEIDCRNDKIRRVQAVAYRGDVQQGGVVWVNRQTTAWTNVGRDSLNQSAQLRACSKDVKGFKIYTDQFNL